MDAFVNGKNFVCLQCGCLVRNLRRDGHVAYRCGLLEDTYGLIVGGVVATTKLLKKQVQYRKSHGVDNGGRVIHWVPAHVHSNDAP